MSKISYKLSIFAFAICSMSFAAQAQRTVITFEDAANQAGNLDGYHGISGWHALGSISESGYGTGIGQYYFHVQSTGGLSFDNGPVVFEGMNYNAWSTAGVIPSYDLFYQGNLVFTGYVDTDNQPDGLYWVESGYSGKIDRIDFYTQSDGVAFDNFTYMTAAVPEPLTSAMLISGLALVGVCVRKRMHCDRRDAAQADLA